MEKKTMDTLRTMICGELDDIAKEGKLSHESLDILKDLLESAKNLEKIEKYKEEKEEKEMGMNMDRGYSQRKYYIDADYQPGVNSYARGGQGNSYGYTMGRPYDGGSYMNRNGYVDDGNSYMYYPDYNMPMYSMARDGYNGGYSRHTKQETIDELQELMNQTQDMKMREAIQKTITKLNK